MTRWIMLALAAVLVAAGFYIVAAVGPVDMPPPVVPSPTPYPSGWTPGGGR